MMLMLLKLTGAVLAFLWKCMRLLDRSVRLISWAQASGTYVASDTGSEEQLEQVWS